MTLRILELHRNDKTVVGMQKRKLETEMHKLKTYYNELRNEIIHSENKEQVSYLQKRVNNAIAIARKYAKKEGLSQEDFVVTQIYIFLFYFRIFDSLDKTSTESEETSGKKGKLLIDRNKIYEDFNLSAETLAEINRALADYTVPVAKHFSLPIQVGHDAVTSIFGQKKFIKRLNETIDEFDFYFPTSVGRSSERYAHVLDYLTKTRYYSSVAVDTLLKKKIQNKNKLIKYIQQQKTASSISNNKQAMTMVKTSSRNQIDLVSIADKKAGIMITVNSILLTILIPLFASYIFDFTSYIIPIIILVVTCGFTILFATLATRPSANPSDIEKGEKLTSGEKSIFYFKNFAGLTKDQFVEGAHELLTKDAAFDKAIFTDLYDVGIDLDRKYNRLRWCYTIFASGILLTVLSFISCVIFFSAT